MLGDEKIKVGFAWPSPAKQALDEIADAIPQSYRDKGRCVIAGLALLYRSTPVQQAQMLSAIKEAEVTGDWSGVFRRDDVQAVRGRIAKRFAAKRAKVMTSVTPARDPKTPDKQG